MSTDEKKTSRNLDMAADPTAQIVTTIADLKGTDPVNLRKVWTVVGELPDYAFSCPLSPDADARVSFTYEGYRVTLEQDGSATFEELE